MHWTITPSLGWFVLKRDQIQQYQFVSRSKGHWMRAQCSKQLSVLKNIFSVIAYILVCIGIRVSIVLMILDMFFAPHGCCWAKHTNGKSLLVHSQIPGLVHTPFYFWRKKIHIYSVSDVRTKSIKCCVFNKWNRFVFLKNTCFILKKIINFST